MLQIFFIYIVLATTIGFFGRNRGFGFWGFFFASLLFTPFIGFLMLLASFCGKKNQA